MSSVDEMMQAILEGRAITAAANDGESYEALLRRAEAASVGLKIALSLEQYGKEGRKLLYRTGYGDGYQAALTRAQRIFMEIIRDVAKH